jgi:hypothetical protein
MLGMARQPASLGTRIRRARERKRMWAERRLCELAAERWRRAGSPLAKVSAS